MFIQVSSNSFGQRVPHLAKALQRPPNDYQRSDVGQRINVAQRHGNLSNLSHLDCTYYLHGVLFLTLDYRYLSPVLSCKNIGSRRYCP